MTAMALDTMTKPPEGRKIRLETLVRLRWLAVAGQAVSIFIVAGVLQFSIPLVACVIFIALLAAVNAWLQFSYPSTWRLDPPAALALLAFDLLQLAALLYVTGGLTNPFA